ncbi:hypothetical protein LAZ67_6000819 [Cordylochernes scorpioides]|uniref:Mos1 transposase HTH domain-containing protein n=1 Tax=Cordylochernes scorpioides TaxID=51811 RepID=A0ABY6KIX9_9ARAC|nr:hypothetical protein LAZ67_6000819 [Cordylochernes scorpioides]
MLNCDQKQHRMNIANEMLDSVRDDPNLLQRVITGDEAWVYGYDVETKAQSSQWKLPHEPRPKKARQARSNVKVLLTGFFDCRGVVHHEFLPQGRTVNKEYYLQVMRNLREAIRQKRPDLWKNKNWLLHHDNAPAHTSLLVRDFLAKNNTLMMPQPPYSPDLAPCDFFLFPKLKRPMKGRQDKKQESSKMETNEIRAVIKYLCKKGMSPKEIYEDMVDTLREDVPSYSTVKKWVAAFKLGRISTEDEHRPGKPIESVTQENIDKIHDLVMLDRRMTVRQIEETLGIPKTTVDRIMREHLGLRKLSARWVPKLLPPDQKAVRRKLSSDNLALFEANLEEFVNIFVTMDETWAHHFAPESKQQSMQWRHSGSPPPKKPRQFHQQGRLWCLSFEIPSGQTITGNYYEILVKQLREAIKEKRRGKLSRKIVYHQDNAPSHRSLQAMAAIYDSGFKLLPYTPYSPDLALSGFHPFPYLKKSLSAIHFRSDEEVIDAVTSFFESLETSFFLEGIKALEHRWKKSIDLKGDYVEK